MSDYLLVRGDARRIPLPDRSVDFVLGSPPYLSARLYLEGGEDLGIARGFEAWVAWMLDVTAEALRVSKGAVVWVAAGSTKGRNYQPACEALMTDWYRRGGHAYRPCYWHRVGIPGSGGDQWFRADVEYAMCFKRPGPLPWAEPTAMGRKPKYGPGGPMSNRLQNGSRVSLPGHSRNADGAMGKRGRPCHERYAAEGMIANPGVLIATGAAGGGNLGSAHAHINEAPFPVELAEFFVRSLCVPGGTVLDPFSGSGSTVEAALKHGRRGVGLDLRQSQCDLAARRISRPHSPAIRQRDEPLLPLFANP